MSGIASTDNFRGQLDWDALDFSSNSSKPPAIHQTQSDVLLQNLKSVAILQHDATNQIWTINELYLRKNKLGEYVETHGMRQLNWKLVKQALLPLDPLITDQKRQHQYQNSLRPIYKKVENRNSFTPTLAPPEKSLDSFNSDSFNLDSFNLDNFNSDWNEPVLSLDTDFPLTPSLYEEKTLELPGPDITPGKVCLNNLEKVDVLRYDASNRTWTVNKTYLLKNKLGGYIAHRSGWLKLDWKHIAEVLLPIDPLITNKERKLQYHKALKYITKKIMNRPPVQPTPAAPVAPVAPVRSVEAATTPPPTRPTLDGLNFDGMEAQMIETVQREPILHEQEALDLESLEAQEHINRIKQNIDGVVAQMIEAVQRGPLLHAQEALALEPLEAQEHINRIKQNIVALCTNLVTCLQLLYEDSKALQEIVQRGRKQDVQTVHQESSTV